MPETEQAEKEFGVLRRWWRFSPSFNVGPARYVPVIRMHDSEVEGVLPRWGLVPGWAEGDASKARAVGASGPTLEQAPATRGAWGLGRGCIVPMFGFYTCQHRGQEHRQPFFVR